MLQNGPGLWMLHVCRCEWHNTCTCLSPSPLIPLLKLSVNLSVQAVCCSDHVHCCSKGYKCDMKRQGCFKEDDNSLLPFLEKIPSTVQDNVCPDGQSSCPSGDTCCASSSGGYGCCPEPNVRICSCSSSFKTIVLL